jgi:hypothetical protein
MAEKDEKEKKEKKTEKETKPKSNKLVLILAILGAIVIVVALAGRFAYRTFLSKTTGGIVDIDKEGGKVTVKSEETEFSFEEGGELPENFPKDFPTYPKAKLTSSWTASSDETEGLSLVWETNDSIDKVAAYYKEKLTELGWKLSLTAEVEDSTTLAFEKNDTGGFIGITTEDSKTIISLTLGL